ncbi:MAG: NADH:flavin oxidoreductase/NADH oxidase [Acidipropionibacterium sp.]|nr:NADH:flavin oxidoreductase/NADH oxidase [Acidipropionibacterium sp.]
MTRPALFQPLELRGLTLPNRAWVPPMCQYSVDAQDGVPTQWHLLNYGSFAIGGFGLIVAEATAVDAVGRISPFDTGLWNDQQVDAWRTVTDAVHSLGGRIAVQLGHAGRKASTNRWWPGHRSGVVPAEEGGWQPVGPTTQPGDGAEFVGETVHALTEPEILAIIDDFAAAARRAVQAGFDAIEIHSAHGYLLHQFYSPLSNTRTDGWGGDLDGRLRLPVEVARAVRGAIPDQMPLLARLSVTDWREDGWTAADSVELTRRFKAVGVDLLDASSGGNSAARIPIGPGYQADLAAQVRAGADIPVSTVGMIWEPELAERLIAEGRTDAVMVGRGALRDSNWPLRAAHELGLPNEEAPWQPQRFRGAWS